MSIPAEAWNELLRAVQKAQAREDEVVQIARGRDGQTISAAPGSGWAHPWTISPRWDDAGQNWEVTVLPGFVNGRAPVVRAPGAADTTLCDRPTLPTPWMALGIDGAAGNAVPQFFQDRGVHLAAAVDEDDPESAVAPSTPPEGNRLLRKCDVVLHQPRAGLVSDVQIDEGIATGQATTTVMLTLRAIDPTDALRVYTISQWMTAEGEPDPETGAYAAPTYDEAVIGTVYLLSPPDAAPYSAPDQTWVPYAQHFLFWNLSYAQPAFRPVATQIGEPLLVPLAAGAGQAIINEFTSLNDDALNQALEFIGEQSMQGSFWAATGGGSDARFPQTAEAPAGGSTGLDKDGRLAAQRAQQQAAMLAESLDPVFPFYAPAFNLALLLP